LLDDFCVGPVLTLGVLNALGVGGQARWKWLGLAVDYQVLPTITYSQIGLGLSSLSIDARVFPAGGGVGPFRNFHVYVGFGTQWLNGKVSAGGTEVYGQLAYPGPRVGLGFMGRRGLVLGFDVSVLFRGADTAVAISSNLPASQQQDAAFQQLAAAINQDLQAFIAYVPVVPQVNLLRLGYAF